MKEPKTRHSRLKSALCTCLVALMLAGLLPMVSFAQTEDEEAKDSTSVILQETTPAPDSAPQAGGAEIPELAPEEESEKEPEEEPEEEPEIEPEEKAEEEPEEPEIAAGDSTATGEKPAATPTAKPTGEPGLFGGQTPGTVAELEDLVDFIMFIEKGKNPAPSGSYTEVVAGFAGSTGSPVPISKNDIKIKITLDAGLIPRLDKPGENLPYSFSAVENEGGKSVFWISYDTDYVIQPGEGELDIVFGVTAPNGVTAHGAQFAIEALVYYKGTQTGLGDGKTYTNITNQFSWKAAASGRTAEYGHMSGTYVEGMKAGSLDIPAFSITLTPSGSAADQARAFTERLELRDTVSIDTDKILIKPEDITVSGDAELVTTQKQTIGGVDYVREFTLLYAVDNASPLAAELTPGSVTLSVAGGQVREEAVTRPTENNTAAVTQEINLFTLQPTLKGYPVVAIDGALETDANGDYKSFATQALTYYVRFNEPEWDKPVERLTKTINVEKAAPGDTLSFALTGLDTLMSTTTGYTYLRMPIDELKLVDGGYDLAQMYPVQAQLGRFYTSQGYETKVEAEVRLYDDTNALVGQKSYTLETGKGNPVVELSEVLLPEANCALYEVARVEISYFNMEKVELASKNIPGNSVFLHFKVREIDAAHHGQPIQNAAYLVKQYRGETYTEPVKTASVRYIHNYLLDGGAGEIVSKNKTVENLTSPGDYPLAGDDVLCTLYISNNYGAGPLKHIDIYDTVDSGNVKIDLDSVTVPQGYEIKTKTLAGNNLTIKLEGPLPEGDTLTVTYKGKVQSGVTPGTAVENSFYAYLYNDSVLPPYVAHGALRVKSGARVPYLSVGQQIAAVYGEGMAPIDVSNAGWLQPGHTLTLEAVLKNDSGNGASLDVTGFWAGGLLGNVHNQPFLTVVESGALAPVATLYGSDGVEKRTLNIQPNAAQTGDIKVLGTYDLDSGSTITLADGEYITVVYHAEVQQSNFAANYTGKLTPYAVTAGAACNPGTATDKEKADLFSGKTLALRSGYAEPLLNLAKTVHTQLPSSNTVVSYMDDLENMRRTYTITVYNFSPETGLPGNTLNIEQIVEHIPLYEQIEDISDITLYTSEANSLSRTQVGSQPLSMGDLSISLDGDGRQLVTIPVNYALAPKTGFTADKWPGAQGSDQNAPSNSLEIVITTRITDGDKHRLIEELLDNDGTPTHENPTRSDTYLYLKDDAPATIFTWSKTDTKKVDTDWNNSGARPAYKNGVDVLYSYKTVVPGIQLTPMRYTNGGLSALEPGESLSPGITLGWEIRPDVHYQSSVNQYGRKMVVQLPPGMAYDTTQTPPEGIGEPEIAVVDGCEVLTWDFSGAPGTMYSGHRGYTFLVTTDGQMKEDTYEAVAWFLSYSLTTQAMDGKGTVVRGVDMTALTGGKLNGPFYNNINAVMNRGTVDLTGNFKFISEKTVADSQGGTAGGANPVLRRELDEYTEGEAFTYSLRVENKGTSAYEGLVLVDRLPMAGDSYTNSGLSRGSSLDMALADGTVAVILYDAGGNPRTNTATVQFASLAPAEEIGDADYTATPPAGRWHSSYTAGDNALRVVLGEALAANEWVQVEFDAQITTPAADFPDSAVAINSFGLAFAPSPGTLIKAEPDPVTIAFVDKNRIDTYKVTYHGEGGKTGDDKTEVTDGDDHLLNSSYAVKPNGEVGFSRDGHSFVGWALSSGGEVKYTGVGDTLTITGDLDLYAIWAPDVVPPQFYKVTYHGEGGKTGAGQATLLDGDAHEAGDAYVVRYNAFVGFTRGEYTFKGWALASGGAVQYTGGESLRIQADLDLYAVWEKTPVTPPETYKVTYHGEGGKTTTGKTSVVDGENHALNSQYTVKGNKAIGFARADYTFKGWALASGGKVQYTGTGSETLAITGDVDLYAVWEKTPVTPPETYKVTYHGEGGKTTTGKTSVVDGENHGLNSQYTVKGNKAIGFARADYSFKGWALTSGGKVQYTGTGSETLAITGDVNLYAVWEKNTTPPPASSDPAPSSDPPRPGSSSTPKPSTSSSGATTGPSTSRATSGPASSGAGSVPPVLTTRPTGSNTPTPSSTVPASGASTSRPVTSRVATSGVSTSRVGTSGASTSSPSASTPAGTGGASTPGGGTPGGTTGPGTPGDAGGAASGGQGTISGATVVDPAALGGEDPGPTFSLFGNDVPLGGLNHRGGWSLLSLLTGVLALVSAAYHIIRRLVDGIRDRRPEEEDEDAAPADVTTRQAAGETPAEDEEEARQRRKLRTVRRALSVATGLLPLIVFFILDDVRAPMVFINIWTPYVLLAGLAHLVWCIALAFGKRWKDDEDEDEQEPETAQT